MIDSKGGQVKAIAQIEHALAHGWDVRVRYVFRPFDDVVPSAIVRANATGRWGSIHELPALHMATQRALTQVAAHFADNPRVTVRAFENRTGQEPREIPTESLSPGDDCRYTEYW